MAPANLKTSILRINFQVHQGRVTVTYIIYINDKTNTYIMVYETVVRLPLIVRQPLFGDTRPSQEIEM
jgi:hypothetical protein